jgi:DNA uptake protein ComE-like DNA-binding protein
VVDSNEAQADNPIGADDSGGGTVRGWAGYLTLNSYESNLQPDGTPRININSTDLTQLQSDLKQAVDGGVADFIIAYRQYGPYTGNQVGTSNSTIDLDLTQPSKANFSSVLDIVDAKVQLKSSTNRTTVVVSSPITTANASTMLADIMDKLSASAGAKIPGRINVNQTPRAIMLGIPGMTEEVADAVISKRTAEVTADQPGRRHETWLLEEQVVPDVKTMKALIPFINGGGDVFRAQIVGYFEEQGPAARFEVIIDASTATPRVVLWRDITHLGRGYSIDVLGTHATQ